ncbi:MAG: LptF/LptG family permease, partial [Pseudomonadota bacterium]
PRIIFFEEYAVDLSQMAAGTTRKDTPKPRARYLSELLNPDPNDWRYQQQPGKFRSELHERFASLIYPLAFVFICLAHLGVAQTNRAGKVQAVVTAFAACAGLRLLGLASTNLVTRSADFVPLVYAVPLFGLITAIIHAHLRMRPRRVSPFWQAVGRHVDVYFYWFMFPGRWVRARFGDKLAIELVADRPVLRPPGDEPSESLHTNPSPADGLLKPAGAA